MQRLLSTVLVLGLLVATAAAFAITEGLKLVKSPITRTRVVAPSEALWADPPTLKVFSPVCSCRSDGVALKFWLRSRDDVTVDVVTRDRALVRRLVDSTSAHARWNTFVWNGRTDEGSRARDGVYQFRVKLARAHRTLLLPNEIRLDTHAPRVVASPNRNTISPDGDHQADSVRIDYRLTEPGHALLFVRGRQVVRSRSSKPKGTITWSGRMDGKPLRPGDYVPAVGAVDLAGNRTPTSRLVTFALRVRYIALARHRLVARTATRVGVGVDTDAKQFWWKLGRRHGVAAAGTPLVVRVPGKPGRYSLVVGEHGHVDRAVVVVERRR